ncbi:alanyl-tRNA editing protein [Candidatus Pacearchaeota archaeon]|nr:alanyl-tRNA editing protein [Candidatus Pacearchaeota archaeon]
MTQLLYLKDCYMKEFEAKVTKAEGKLVVLDKTAFYPNSGGQMNDTGTLIFNKEIFNVINVKKQGDEIVHELDRECKGILEEGDIVKGKIDWQRRYRLMRSHTAAHIISEVIHKETGARITGNQLSLERIRIAFDLENFDRAKLQGYISKANEIVEKGMTIKTYFLEREEAFKNPGLFSLKGVLPPEVKELRIVEIEGFDIKACGGTHVANTKEVGRFEFIDAENKGKNNRRVYFRLND